MTNTELQWSARATRPATIRAAAPVKNNSGSVTIAIVCAAGGRTVIYRVGFERVQKTCLVLTGAMFVDQGIAQTCGTGDIPGNVFDIAWTIARQDLGVAYGGWGEPT